MERQRLGNRCPRLPQPPRQILVRITAAVREAVQRLGLLERREIFPLEVLDERELSISASSTSRMTAGSSFSPSWTAAWYRRSPARI